MTRSPMFSDDAQPVRFDQSFGWLHPSHGDTGVVVCHATGRDGHGSYAGFRDLAAELAKLGYPTLRFDYPGVGDAMDLDGEEPCAAWQESIERACELMRGTGVVRIVLVGQRVGALLAAFVAARREDVSGLVMIDALSSGALYLRELALEQILTANFAEETEGRIEADGIVLASASDKAFRALDLRRLQQSPASRILILATQQRSANAKLAGQLSLLGAEVEQDAIEPMREFDEDGSIRSRPPLARIYQWLGTAAPSKVGPPPPAPHGVQVNGGTGFTEHPLRFGPDRTLFGMLCVPSVEASPGFVLVIGSAGGTCHHGYARFTVLLARRLAEAGFASFRIDYAGIGESRSEQATHVYATDRRTDTANAIEALQRAGYSRFGAAGLCSGAFHSLQASLADHRIETLVMLNPSTFSWPKDQDFAKFIQNSSRSTGFYIDTMMGRKGWARLLRGELDVVKALRTVRSHMVGRVRALGLRAAERAGSAGANATPRHAMALVAARRVKILVVIGTFDTATDVLQVHFGRGGRWLAALPGTTLQLLPRIDHSLTRVSMHETVAATLIDFLRSGQTAIDPQPSPGSVPESAVLAVGKAAA